MQVFLGHSGGLDTDGNELPRLVYVSREKRPGFQHHKKAGAMNALVCHTKASYLCSMDLLIYDFKGCLLCLVSFLSSLWVLCNTQFYSCLCQRMKYIWKITYKLML